MPNTYPDWSTDQVWEYPLPISDPSYCEVIETEIISIKEDDL